MRSQLHGEEVRVHLESTGLPAITPAPEYRDARPMAGRLAVQGAVVIDGTGAPPFGPVDILIEDGKFAAVIARASADASPATADHVIDATGMYALPGLVDAHAHLSLAWHGMFGAPPPAEYVQKLWLAHGVTTVRDAGSMHGLGLALDENRRAESGEIAAPRVVPYAYLPIDGGYFPGSLFDEASTKRWVNDVAARGAKGLKILGGRADLMRAAISEAKQLDLRTMCHHAQLSVAQQNVLDSARMGLTSAEHWYGLPEALLDRRTVQNYPADYNYLREEDRFGEAGRLWAQTVEAGSSKWESVRDELLSFDFTLNPTFAIYEANRDVMRARRADWQDDYAWPALTRFFEPNPDVHGAHFFAWTTAHEIAWKRNYQRWMEFVQDYKNHGGRVTTGSDAGFSYQLYGFTLIRELEMLQEAGFHALEVLRAATLHGAQLLGLEEETGSVQVGKRADLLLVQENPLADFKVLYGTGALRYDTSTRSAQLRQLLRYTIKAGIVYEPARLLAQVRDLVEEQKEKESAQAHTGPDAS
jgi:hypothetical protein